MLFFSITERWKHHSWKTGNLLFYTWSRVNGVWWAQIWICHKLPLCPQVYFGSKLTVTPPKFHLFNWHWTATFYPSLPTFKMGIFQLRDLWTELLCNFSSNNSSTATQSCSRVANPRDLSSPKSFMLALMLPKCCSLAENRQQQLSIQDFKLVLKQPVNSDLNCSIHYFFHTVLSTARLPGETHRQMETSEAERHHQRNESRRLC